MRHLSIRGPKSSSVIKVRSELVKATFNYFYSRGYIYIQTPILVEQQLREEPLFSL